MIRPDRRLAQLSLPRKEVAVMVCNCDGGCKGHAGPAALTGIARLRATINWTEPSVITQITIESSRTGALVGPCPFSLVKSSPHTHYAQVVNNKDMQKGWVGGLLLISSRGGGGDERGGCRP
jgi:hypothetical protein